MSAARLRDDQLSFLRQSGSPAKQVGPFLEIAVEGIANRRAVDVDRALDTADGSTRKGEDMLQERHAPRQISTLVKISQRLPAAATSSRHS